MDGLRGRYDKSLSFGSGGVAAGMNWQGSGPFPDLDMYIALQRLNTFPADTKVCCAHEYTESNLRWAAQQRPNDSSIAARLNEVQQRRSRGELTLPTTLALERISNLFLQADDASALAELREHKDEWQG